MRFRLPKSAKCIYMSPYPGIVLVTRNWKDFSALAKELMDRDEIRGNRAGRFLAGESKLHPHTALVWWTTHATLAHEMAHVIFDLFETVGIPDASCGNNEPFCYLLSQLIRDTLDK